MFVLENSELVIVVFHDGVEDDDEAIEVDEEQVVANAFQNSK